MVALYGGPADVHDFMTRTPGTFEAAMRDFAYLKEAGALFPVKIVPMRANYHQFDQTQALAKTLSLLVRVLVDKVPNPLAEGLSEMVEPGVCNRALDLLFYQPESSYPVRTEHIAKFLSATGSKTGSGWS